MIIMAGIMLHTFTPLLSTRNNDVTLRYIYNKNGTFDTFFLIYLTFFYLFSNFSFKMFADLKKKCNFATENIIKVKRII